MKNLGSRRNKRVGWYFWMCALIQVSRRKLYTFVPKRRRIVLREAKMGSHVRPLSCGAHFPAAASTHYIQSIPYQQRLERALQQYGEWETRAMQCGLQFVAGALTREPRHHTHTLLHAVFA